MEKNHSLAWTLQLNRGVCYMHIEDHERGLRDLNASIAAAGSDAPARFLAKGYFYRAMALFESDSAAAIEDAAEAVRLDPAASNYAALLEDLRRRAASPITPEIKALCDAGCQLLLSGESAAALGKFEEVLKIEPRHAKGLQLKGAALHQLKRYEEELQALKASYELDGNEVALFNLGPCSLALGDIASARSYLRKFVQVGTDQRSVQNARMMLHTLSHGGD